MSKKKSFQKMAQAFNIKSIASGSSGNAHLVGDQILLDCGIDIDTLRKHLGNVTKLSGCLVTHEHGDHAGSVEDLLRAGVDVYMDNLTIEAMELDHHRIHEIHPIVEVYEIGDFKVKGFPLVHDSKGGTGYLLKGQGKKIAYITDTRLTSYKFKGVTHLLVEANFSWQILREQVEAGVTSQAKKNRVIDNHLSLKDVKRLIKESDTSKLEEVRLLHLSNDNADEERFRQEITELVEEENFGISVKVPARHAEEV